MGEKIQFPGNYERYINMGQEALKRQDMATACAYYEKAYEVESSFALNFLILTTYFELGEFEKGFVLAQDYLEDYMEEMEYFSFYVHLLILNERFVEAHLLLNQRLFERKSAEEMLKIAQLKQDAHQQELIYVQFQRAEIQELKSELLCLPNLTAFEQFSEVKEALHLPQDDFVEIAEKLLMNERVNVLSKSWLMEHLVSMHVNKKIKFLWLNEEEREVNPSELDSPHESENYYEMVYHLHEELGQHDPILTLHLLEEIRLFYSMIYPFEKEIIQHPLDWVKSYLLEYWQEYEEKISSNEATLILKTTEKRKKIQEKMQLL